MLGDLYCLTCQLSQTRLRIFLSGRETKTQQREGHYIRVLFQLLETLGTFHCQCARNCFDGAYEIVMRTFERLPVSSSESVGVKIVWELETRLRMVSLQRHRRYMVRCFLS